MGSNTITYIKQSFQILAQCPGVHSKRKGSSGWAERFPCAPLVVPEKNIPARDSTEGWMDGWMVVWGQEDGEKSRDT